MSFHHPSCPAPSPLHQVGMKATAGEGERGEASDPGGWSLSAPRGSHLPRAMARGVSVPVGVLMTGLPPCARLALYKAATCKSLGAVSVRPAGQLEPTGDADQLATWARARKRGWVLTLKLQGQKLAALGSYKNGKSRFFTI